ncbi:MAG: photosynthetic reaction center cytochrome PufC [Rubrivivax sp.]
MKRSLLITCLGLAALLAGCERPPVQSTQNGYRGTGMVQVQNPRTEAKKLAAETPPPELPPSTPADGQPLAKDIYQNVQVLGDLPVGEFTRHMLAITAWVAPEQGCTYCHGDNLADDSKYQKVVARRMLQMNRTINAGWKTHVADTGVTCYTCHRGKPVPDKVWFTAPTPKMNRVGPGFGDDAGQNRADPSIALASLPYDPFTPFLLNAEPIRAQGTTALPTGNRASTKQAEWTYSLMNHMSEGLGVNCTFCHNTQSFQSWQGPPQRATAWHGLRMARTLNTDYLVPLTASFPAHRLGPTGDVAKVNCATCHQGVNKPLRGLAMAKDFAGLTGPAPAATAAVEVPAAGVTPVAAAAPSGVKAVLLFGVSASALPAAQSSKLAPVIAALKAQPAAKAVVSGYHSATGTLAANQELSKKRAFAVRDALAAAGIAADRIQLEKPQQTEANAAGEDTAARRVEVSVR